MSVTATAHLARDRRVSFLQQVAVLILTFNEAPNIARTLEALTRFPEVLVLDSGSTDDTVAIARRFPNVRIAFRAFDQHSAQWNHGLKACGIERPWVLALDADYVLTPAVADEIEQLPVSVAVAGFEAKFRYCVYGRRLSAALYPPHVVLFRRDSARYVQKGHTQRIVVEGSVQRLRHHIDHDDRKALAHWLRAQQNYARLEAEFLLANPKSGLRPSDRLRRMGWPAPLVVPLYMLFFKRCMFAGSAGWLYVLQRALAEVMIALEINDRKLRNKRLAP